MRLKIEKGVFLLKYVSQEYSGKATFAYIAINLLMIKLICKLRGERK